MPILICRTRNIIDKHITTFFEPHSLKKISTTWRERFKSVCGINLPPSKKMLLEGRLRKRLRHLGMNSFQEYCRYLFEQDGFSVERQSIIDLVTTNKTDFFRESRQFEYLSQYILPEIQQLSPPGSNQRLKAWRRRVFNGRGSIHTRYGNQGIRGVQRSVRFFCFCHRYFHRGTGKSKGRCLPSRRD